jgi:hypothetical protein
VIRVGSTKTTGSHGSRSPLLGASAAASDAGVAESARGAGVAWSAAAAALGGIVVGNAGVGTAAGGTPGDGSGVARAVGAAAGVGAEPDGDAVQGFGLVAWGGGLGVTSSRHDEREAKTPW